LIEKAGIDVNNTENYSDLTRYQDGVLLAKSDNVSTAVHEGDLLFARDFSTLSSEEDIRSFASHHGFLSKASKLRSVRAQGEEFVFEPISEWHYLIREIAFINALIDLCFKHGIKRVEELIGGVYPPHRVAYMGQSFNDRFELELIGPDSFFDMRPGEAIDQNKVRTSSGVASIGNARGEVTDQELLTKFHGAGHVFQHISFAISRALARHLEFDALSPNAEFMRFTSAGLRTAIWLQVREDLNGRGSVGRCNSCPKHFVISRQGHQFCSSTCAKRFNRASKK
jgi:hypothetical protein